MDCPSCGFGPLPQDTRYCPDCGRSVDIIIRVSQDVRKNLGQVIGVQTGVIHGDVYGGDIYQVQVYILSETGRQAGRHDRFDPDVPPYKFLAPFEAKDRTLFRGREAEIQQVVRQLGERLLVVFGQPGVGKTSFLTAGVIPELTEAGALVLYIPDYSQPLEATLRAALAASHNQLPLTLPENASLPVLIKAVRDETQGTIVLVFDQFESFLRADIDPEERALQINAIVESLRIVEPEFLRLILAIRDDAMVSLASLREALPDLFRSFVEIKPFNYEQARAAILEPLHELNWPIQFEEDLLQNVLLRDLDDLTPNTPDQIHPPHLQIVCHWLYRMAVERRPPLVDKELYFKKAKGADGILARYLDETLRTQLADQKAMAERILISMVSPGVGRWISPGQLRMEDASPDQVQTVLDRLVGAKLLTGRSHNGGALYALTSHTMAEKIRRMAGPELERRYQASDELQRVWDAWLARDVLATRGQLRYLVDSYEHLALPGQRLRPARILLLLRSAVAQGEPTRPWLVLLRTEAGQELIRELEYHTTREEQPSEQGSYLASTFTKAAGILGMGGVSVPDIPTGKKREFGPLSWTAVSHRDPVIRQTAALALTVPDRHRALDRLDWALKAGPKGWRRRLRLAELRGALADADPLVDKLNADLPLPERTCVWLWRFWQRWLYDRHRIGWLTLAGASAGGLGMGLLRAVLGIPTSRLIGVQFAMYFWWGAILAAFLALGIAVATPLLSDRWQDTIEPSIGTRPSVREGYFPALVTIVLVAIFFLAGHTLVTGFNGLNLFTYVREPLRVLMVCVAGLGLGTALYGLVQAKDATGIVRKLFRPVNALRLSIAGIAFMLVEWVFLIQDKGPGLAIAWSESFYRAEFHDLMNQVTNRYPHWPEYLALADAALVGMVLAISINLGTMLATIWLTTRPKIEEET